MVPNSEIQASHLTSIKDSINNHLLTSTDNDYGTQSAISTTYTSGNEIKISDVNELANKINDISKYCVCNAKVACGCQTNCPSNCSCQSHCTCNCVGHCPCNVQCSCNSEQTNRLIASYNGTIANTGTFSATNHIGNGYQGTITRITMTYTIYPYTSGWSAAQFKAACGRVTNYHLGGGGTNGIYLYGNLSNYWSISAPNNWYERKCYTYSANLEENDPGYSSSKLGPFSYSSADSMPFTNSGGGFTIRSLDTSLSGNVKVTISNLQAYGNIRPL